MKNLLRSRQASSLWHPVLSLSFVILKVLSLSLVILSEAKDLCNRKMHRSFASRRMTIRVQLAGRGMGEKQTSTSGRSPTHCCISQHYRCKSLQLGNLTTRQRQVVVFPHFGRVPKNEPNWMVDRKDCAFSDLRWN